MGYKIKKEAKLQLQDFPRTKIKYNIAVPVLGIADALAMFNFFLNPATSGNLGLKIFFLIFAIVGLGFAYWGFMWNITADGNAIVIHPAFGEKKTLPVRELKKAVVYKRRQTDTFSSYELVDQNDRVFVKIYPIMKDSALLLTRLQRYKVPVTEIFK